MSKLGLNEALYFAFGTVFGMIGVVLFAWVMAWQPPRSAFDADENGSLNLTEFRAGINKLFTLVDTNNDGIQ